MIDVNVFLDELEKLLKKMEYQTARLDGQEPQIGDTLRAMVPVDETGSMVLLEVLLGEYNDDRGDRSGL